MEDVLYHYCPLDAFLGIIQSKEIWLTNIFCMNDSAEHYWLRGVAKDVLRKRIDQSEDEFAKLVASGLFPKDEETQLYCCCFSEESDSLGQWRAYADDGHGVAIGFLAEDLEQLPKANGKANDCLAMEQVVYEREEQERLVMSFLDDNRPVFDELASTLPASLHGPLAEIPRTRELWHEAARCKNPAFREENEVRLIYEPRRGWPLVSDRRFRVSGRRLISYYALSFSEENGATPICEVVFGPKNDHRHNEQLARAVLQDNGYSIDRIHFRVSEATYR